MRDAISYDDVLLAPAYSDIKSRSEVSIETDLGNGLVLELPIIASPMDTISESAMAVELGNSGGAAVIHRYNTVEMQARQVQLSVEVAKSTRKSSINVGAAVGISGDYLQRAQACMGAGATFICVDVAHGHHIMMKDALTELRATFGEELHIMAGNVATLE